MDHKIEIGATSHSLKKEDNNSEIDTTSPDWRKEIVDKIVKKNYVKEINDFIQNRRRWKKHGRNFETGSKIFIGIGSILSFASGVYDSKELSFAAGAISVISMVLLQYATFSYRESSKSTQDLNILLDSIGIKKIPEMNATLQSDDIHHRPPTQTTNSQQNPDPMITTPNSGMSIQASDFRKQNGISEPEEQMSNISESEENQLEYLNVYKTVEENMKIAREYLVRNPSVKYPHYWISYICKKKDFNNFKEMIKHGIEVNQHTIIDIIIAGLEYVKEFVDNNYSFISNTLDEYCINIKGKEVIIQVKEGETTALLGGVLSGDINTLKYVYSIIGDKWLQTEAYELRYARQQENKEILLFCIKNGAKNEPYQENYKSNLKKLEEEWKREMMSKKVKK